jgi:hypothetical protein
MALVASPESLPINAERKSANFLKLPGGKSASFAESAAGSPFRQLLPCQWH